MTSQEIITKAKRLCRASLIVGLVIIMLLSSACRVQEPEAKPEPYEYSHTTELKYYEFYEGDRIKDAERSVVMTLAGQGYADLTLTGGEVTESPVVAYSLPDDATQGPETWYIVHFHFLIEFDETTGGGFCSVSAQGASASVEFETLKVNDSPLIRIAGQPVSSTSIKIEVRYYNYLTYSDVKPGENSVSFSYKEYQGTKIKSVTVFNDTGIEVTNVSPSSYEEGLKLTQEEQVKAKEIAFNDPQVQELTDGKEYALRITRADGLIRAADEPPDDDIEVRLIFSRNYMIEDIEASALDIFVDLTEEEITYLFPLSVTGMPELTASMREKAVSIALNDTDVQKLLEGKQYTIKRIGPSQGGPIGRLGANIELTFDRSYPFKGEFPLTAEESFYLDAELEGLKVFINLKEGKVVELFNVSPPVINGGGR